MSKGNNGTSEAISSLENETDTKFYNISDNLMANLNMDVQNIDIGRLHQKINEIVLQYGDEPRLNNTRRQALHDRAGFVGYRIAERFKAKTKALDMMVQLLYMARQKLRLMQDNEFFDTASFGFRIAYAHRRCQRLWRNIGLVYKVQFDFKKRRMDLTPSFMLHHKAARLHVDITYLFWLIIKLDLVNKERRRRALLLQMIKSGKRLPPGVSIPVTWG